MSQTSAVLDRNENKILVTWPIRSEAKDALNVLVQSYKLARESWLTYRGAIATHATSEAYFAELNKNLTDLSNAIRDLRGKEVKK